MVLIKEAVPIPNYILIWPFIKVSNFINKSVVYST